MGNAWGDIAAGDDLAHQPAECSGRGHCNTGTGECECMSGYEGLACSRMSCPSDCSRHGECHSMRLHATYANRNLVNSPSVSTSVYTYTAPWDADMVHGCSCDAGYEGWDCALRRCPRGDDPMTVGQSDERQLLRCDLSPNAGSGAARFTLSFRGATTRPFGAGATADVLQAALEELPTIGRVGVAYSSGSTLCDNSFASVAAPSVPPSGNIVTITFLTEHGDVPSLVVLDARGRALGADSNYVFIAVDGDTLTYTTSTSPSTASVTSAVGSKEDAECSGRGKCNAGSGACTCYTGFGSSDGRGNEGATGDCGYALLPITSCPGVAVECSGHGVCSRFPEYRCTCFAGWGSGDCSLRTCPTAAAWFSYPVADDEAHTPVECSNKGSCDRRTGQCTCQSMFEGAACERMTCPGDRLPGGSCNGHGQCLSMAELALHATANGDATPYSYGADPNLAATWDADKVFGCLCDEGYSGFDCSLRTCPLGNDITLLEWDAGALDEAQALVCELLATATGTPTFRLEFRQAQTAALPYTATGADIQAALEALPTIGRIKVEVSSGPTDPACAAAGAGLPPTINFLFQTEHGDVPPIRVVMDAASRNADGTYNAGAGWADTDLEWTGGNPAADYATGFTYTAASAYPATGVRARVMRTGRSGNAECSGRGLCNRSTGACQCFAGFGASDGNRGPGVVEDCGWREPWAPRVDRY
jgi:hypothetical protein